MGFAAFFKAVVAAFSTGAGRALGVNLMRFKVVFAAFSTEAGCSWGVVFMPSVFFKVGVAALSTGAGGCSWRVDLCLSGNAFTIVLQAAWP